MVTTIELDAFLADAVVAVEGKLYAQGVGWNVINTPTIPARHSRIGVGVLIHVPYTATNEAHRLEMSLEDEDGQTLPVGDNPSGEGKIQSIGGQFNVGRPPTLQHGDEQIIPFAIQIDGYLFEKAGGYRVVISIDGEKMKELPFRVLLIPSPQPIIKPMKEG